ncbi:hypothetical protein GOZ83_13220 [Agrobacterium vitis]|uniref:hypothetical protein n=1 Tax=Rhizobium/Agrobacterium group TaxID=227290 RepID=UPI0012E80FCE|nr:MULTISPECIES: hypothetical protein [Rhizobium/Agrobacterium group]MCF1494518.1 hypothetical protein [Allorhizobium ampelinum]MVA46024.1 hypothetical protein [Agrobacterium vitis]
MASPWKFLARLVSPQRQPKQDDSAIEAIKADVLAVTGPTETTVEESRDVADHLAREQLQPVDRSDAVAITPEPSDETRNDAAGVLENGSDNLELASGAVLPDVGVIVAKVDKTAKSTRPERRTRAKKVEAAAVVLQVSSAAASVSDEMVSLDEEIAMLRTQLAGKLRLQNAQLKRMLARF